MLKFKLCTEAYYNIMLTIYFEVGRASAFRISFLFS